MAFEVYKCLVTMLFCTVETNEKKNHGFWTAREKNTSKYFSKEWVVKLAFIQSEQWDCLSYLKNWGILTQKPESDQGFRTKLQFTRNSGIKKLVEHHHKNAINKIHSVRYPIQRDYFLKK